MWICNVCDESFNEPEVFKDYESTYEHGVFTEYLCPYCGSSNIENTKQCYICFSPMAESDDTDLCKTCKAKVIESYKGIVMLTASLKKKDIRRMHDCISYTLCEWLDGEGWRVEDEH